MNGMRTTTFRRNFCQNILTGFNEGRIIFDRYLEQALKNKARQKRVVTSTEYEVHPEMKLSMSPKELLSTPYTRDVTFLRMDCGTFVS